jgi:hypothetical protein
MAKFDTQYPGTDKARLTMFNDNKHIQFLAKKLQDAIYAYDADNSQENEQAAVSALNVYNLHVKELHHRIDNGYTY